MTYFNQHIDEFIGIFFILISVILFIFPPKFRNKFYGVCTTWTLKNETIWFTGQKLLALSLFILGILLLITGLLNLFQNTSSLSRVILLIGFWGFVKFGIDKILEKKYSKLESYHS